MQLTQRAVLAIAAVTAGFGTLALVRFDGGGLSARLLQAAALAGELGPAGVALYAAAFVVATLLLVPTASLEMAGGLLFVERHGMPAATAIAGCSKLLACSVHYVLGRSLLRDHVEARILPRFPIFKTVSRLVATDPFKVACAIRLAPIPSIAKNFGLAALDVPYVVFTLVTAMFSIPWTVGAVLVGSSLNSLPEILDGRGQEKLKEVMRPWTENWQITAAVLVPAVAGLVYVAFIARRAYADVVSSAEAEAKQGQETKKSS